MGRTLSAKHLFCFPFLALVLFTVLACTKKKESVSSISIQFPKPSLRNQSVSSQSGTSWDATDPTSVTEIDCYAVFIGANESGFSESYCTNTNNQQIMRFGLFAGLFDAATTTSTTLEVKSGPSRTIYIVGMSKLAGLCEKDLRNLTFSNYSYPFLLGSQTVSLQPGNVQVSVNLQNSFTATNKISSCSFMSQTPTAPVTAKTITDIKTAYQHACAVLSDGSVKCWGSNSSGKLGQGNANNIGDGANEMGANLPAVDLGAGLAATQVAVGDYHSCALLTGGVVKCWGDNNYGQLGLDDQVLRGDGPSEMGANLAAVNLGGTATMIAAGSYFSCALLSNSTVKCWGRNSKGQLGIGNTIDEGTAAGDMAALPTVNLGGTPVGIYAGGSNACAILSDGHLKCWGEGTGGALGNGGVTDSSTPVSVSGIGAGTGVQKVEIGVYSACAVFTSGALKCWGSNAYGQLGDGTTTSSSTPVQIFASGVSDVSMGAQQHTCAVLTDGTAKCWGYNTYGNLGLNSTTNYTSPQTVLDIAGATKITVGYDFTCARLANTGVKCWGNNSEGQLGVGDTSTRGNSANSMSALVDVDLDL